MADFRSILITGASSGLGEALALDYAAPGVTLFLSGRDVRRVGAVVAACRTRGATVEGRVIDVSDRVAMGAWVGECDTRALLDLVIANAGVAGAERGYDASVEGEARHVLPINIDGVVNTVLPALELMRGRKRGQIAIMSSLASFRGFGSSPAYSASKAAVRVWGEGLRLRVAKDGIGVTVICPGFVRSRMTDGNSFPMPFLMDSNRAARIMRQGIAANRSRITYPWPMAALVWVLAVLPPAWTDRFLIGR
jgi:short-subunit dehydrogenase